MAIFSYKTAFIFPSNPTGQQLKSLLNVFENLSYRVSTEKSTKVAWKVLKSKKSNFFGIFVIVGLRLFFQTNCLYLFEIVSPGQLNFSSLNGSNILSHKVFRKIDKNCVKFLKIRFFWDFCQLRFDFEAFFSKNCIYHFEKTFWKMCSFRVERLLFSMLASLSSTKKTLKIWTFWKFIQIRSQFEAGFHLKKLDLFLQKSLLDN